MKDYLQTLMEIEKRCTESVRVMAQGVLELKDSHHVDKMTETSIQYFLDRFYMSRIRYYSVILLLLCEYLPVFSLQPQNAHEPAHIAV